MDEIVNLMEEKIQVLKDLKFLKENDKAELVKERIVLVDLVDSSLANHATKKEVPSGEFLYPVLINGKPEYELRVKEKMGFVEGVIFLSFMKTKDVVRKQEYLNESGRKGRKSEARLLEIPFLKTNFFVEGSPDHLQFYSRNDIKFSDIFIDKKKVLNLDSLSNIIQRFIDTNLE